MLKKLRHHLSEALKIADRLELEEEELEELEEEEEMEEEGEDDD